MAEELSFTMIDGLPFAAARGRLTEIPCDTKLVVRDLGPFLEYLLLSKAGLLPAPSEAQWLSLNGTADLHAALSNRRHRWICPKTRHAGIFRTFSANTESVESSWTEFCYAAQFAAVDVGFPKGIAAQLVGAIGEMEGNIHEHSNAPKSGVVVFQATPGTFEFVVADRGIGVLASLNSSPAYVGLTDHGEALRLTLTDGVTRLGEDSNRGHGFRSLFIGLANLHGYLRFRSGDHALTIEGDSPTVVSATLAKKTPTNGFFVSVRCHLF
jgi:hypothetical protein